MARKIDPRHIQDKRSKNGPGKNKGQFPWADARIRGRTPLDSSRKRQHSLKFGWIEEEKTSEVETDIKELYKQKHDVELSTLVCK